MREVHPDPVPLEPYQRVFGAERSSSLRSAGSRVRDLLGDRRVWNINSTAAGGGVAELLSCMVPLARAFGLDARWLVIDGDPEFFALTKRLCTLLYGSAGDGGPTGPEQLRRYRQVIDQNADHLRGVVRAGDIVVVHEAQPAGLVAAAKAMGATVVYRSHTGRDEPNEHTRRGWEFVRPFVEKADATVFLTASLVPDWARGAHIIPPSIDPCSPKNMALDRDLTTRLLAGVGVIDGRGTLPVSPQPVDGLPGDASQ